MKDAEDEGGPTLILMQQLQVLRLKDNTNLTIYIR